MRACPRICAARYTLHLKRENIDANNVLQILILCEFYLEPLILWEKSNPEWLRRRLPGSNARRVDYNDDMQRGELPRSAKLALARIHPAALGTSLGSVTGLWVAGVTLTTVFAGDDRVRHSVALIAQYWPGYRVSAVGAVCGLLYGFISGFAAGYCFASLRNAIIRIYLAYVRRRAEQQQLQDILDRLG
jgi:hypothetical protein